MAWIYVTGRGHSGTTFLDVVLGNTSHIQSFGEIISAIDRLGDSCSCGEPMKDCPFWSKVILSLGERDSDWLSEVKFLKEKSHIQYWPLLFLTGGYGKHHKRLVKANKSLHDAIQSLANSKWILDSSKELTRALFILSTNTDAKVIHLVRSPLGVANSYKKRYVKYGYFKFLRRRYYIKNGFFILAAVVGLSWFLGNIMIELMRLTNGSRIIRIKYENAIEKFEDTMDEIGAFIGVDLKDIIDMQNDNLSFTVGHNIGGNHMRTKKKIFLVATNEDSILTPFETNIIKVTTFFLRKKYGY